MAHLVAEAVEIISDDGTGVPVTYTNTAVGLASDGHLYLITDRFALNGSKTITGDTPRTVWYEGILTRDFGAFAVSRTCDFVEAGALETVSGLSFGVQNAGAFFNTLAAHGVYLGRRTVKYYRVTSSDGITFNFELRWTGIVDDQPFTETTYSVQCVDVSKEIFKSLPPNSVNSTAFPAAPSASLDKPVPIVLGRVAYSPLVNVSGGGTKATLAMLGDPVYPHGLTPAGGNAYTVAACLAYTPSPTTPPADATPTPPDLLINTPGVYFVASDARLVGKYLHVIAGGVEQSILILDNDVTSVSNNTDLYLAENLDVSTAFVAWLTIDQDDPLVWYVEVVDLAPILLASDRTIYEAIDNVYSQLALSTYSSNLNAYDDISEINAEESLSNIKGTGRPGFSILSRSATSEGSPIAYAPIVPTSVKVASLTSMTSGDLPAVGAEAPALFDRDDTDYYTMTGSAATKSVAFDVLLPSDNSLKDFDALYLVMDLAHKNSVGGACLMNVSAQAKDIYGRVCSSVYSYTVKNSSLGTSFVDLNRLPGSYVGIERDDTDFQVDKLNFDIKNVIGTMQKSTAYTVVRLTIQIVGTGGITYTLRIKEIGLVGKFTVGVSSETVYAPLRGETFGGTWDGRKTATLYPDNPVDVLEKLVRDYDVAARPWTAAKAYVVGNQVRGTGPLRGHLFLCTTAGTSDATEPTWTDTAGATYTDGTVQWTELKDLPVDATTFDAASAQRTDWKVGRTLDDKKPSADWYATLLAQSFTLALTDRNGKLKVKAWRENTTPLIAFDTGSGGNVVEGTLGEMRPTPMSRVYNELGLRYDKNPGANKFNRQIAVTRVDQPAFPAVDKLLDSAVTTNLGTFTAHAVNTTTIRLETTADHGLVAGNYAYLKDNTDGFSFAPAMVSIETSKIFHVTVPVYFNLSNPSSTGTLYKTDTSLLAWQEYVIGIADYVNAQDLWDQCHASYLVSKAVNKLPEALGDCDWFLDPAATDPGGTPLWPELSTVGDEHAAVFFARNLVNWTAWQKKQVTFETQDTATFSALEVGDPVSFTDAKLTVGATLLGWIHEVTQVPRTETVTERFRFGLTLNPEALVDLVTITESGSQPITITESGSQTDTYTEGA